MTAVLDALDPVRSRALRDELPGVEDAFDEESMRRRLQLALLAGDGHGLEIGRCERRQAAYAPGQGCTVRYQLEVRDRAGGLVTPALANVRLFPDSRSAWLHFVSCLEPLAAAASGRDELAPFVTPVALFEPLAMSVSLFPIDGELPTLVGATDPAAMLEILRGVVERASGTPFTPRRCRVDVAHYPREHHCVLRYTLDDGNGAPPLTLFGKLAGDDRGALTMAAVPDLRERILRGRRRPFAIPRPLAFVQPLRLVLLEAIPGAPRISHLLKLRLGTGDEATRTPTLEETVAWAATVAAGLHTSGVTLRPRRRLEDELLELEHGFAALERISPVLGGEFRGWLDSVAACSAVTDPSPACFSHGDFSPSQLVFYGAGCGLIDFDTICMAEPAMDLGQFLAYLRSTARKAGKSNPADGAEPTERLCARFVEAYAGECGLASEAAGRLGARVQLYEMVSLLRLVIHSWRKFKRDRLELVVGVVRDRLPSLPGGAHVRPG